MDLPALLSGEASRRGKTLYEGETRGSGDAHTEDGWGSEWIDGRLSCMPDCSNCSGKIALAGTYTVRDERGYAYGDEVGGYVKYYKPSISQMRPT